MPKPKSLAKLVDDLAVLLQKLVRLKAADPHTGMCQCVTCKRWYHWKAMDGGHFISRTYKATKVTEEQINPQCKRCNGFPDHFTHKQYEEFMIDRHGKDYVEWLEIESKKPVKFFRPELEDRIKEVSAQIKQLEREAA